ncbi:hypothetical protein CHCC5022_1933 [Bacillus paralicheniformis]|nr:hypothetical protein CHCC5022_1933 [Bacillus paralicheniformis]
MGIAPCAKPSNGFFAAWPALDNPVGKEKIVHAGDVCFR